MKNTRLLKRTICIAMAAIMAVSIPACGKDKGDGTGKGGNKTTEEARDLIEEAKDTSTDGVFEAEDLMVTGFEGDISSLKATEDTIYFLTSEWIEDETATSGDSSEVTASDSSEETSGPVEGELIEGDEKGAPSGADESDVVDEVGPGGEAEDTSVDTADAEETESAENGPVSETGAITVDDYSAIGTSTNRVYKTSIDGGECELLAEMSSESGKELYFDKIVVTSSGDIKIMAEEYTDTDTTYYLYDIANGELTNEVNLNKKLSLNANTWINQIFFDNDGNLIVSTDTSINIYDKDYNSLSEVSSEEYIDACGLTRDGNIIISEYQWDEETETSNTVVKEYDVTKKEFTNEYDLAVSYIAYDGLVPGTDKYLFIYKTSSAVFGYNDATKESEKIIDFNKSDINSDYVSGMEMIGEDKMLTVYWDYMAEESSSTIQLYTKSENAIDKQVLTLATLYGSWDVKQKVINYNKSQDTYKINIVDYSEQDDPAGKLSADIAAGNLPDMFLVENGVGNMSTSQCIAKGLFEDLTPYFEADPDLSEDDFIENAFEALKDGDKLYLVASNAYIDTLIGKASEIGEEPGWTFQEMKDYVNSKPDDCRIFYSTSKSDTLSYFMYSLIFDFIDWDAGTCSFDSQDFKDVLEMCNRGTTEMDWENDEGNYTEMLKSGEMMFLQGSFSPSDISIYDQMYDGDIVYKGYPNSEGSGNYFTFGDGIAMSTTCTDKDGAWQFMREFLTEEGVGSSYINQWGFPIRKDVFEIFMENQTITEETTDKYGNKIYPIEGGMSYDGSTTFEMKPLTEEEVQTFRDYVASAAGRAEYDQSISDIVSEEAEAYFSGDKTVDEVADIIQNRVTTYINENK